jgi:pantetheine-phosphate adenylyltransferase
LAKEPDDMRTAIYAGSFDILTVGHTDIIKKACNIFREVHVVVVNNPDKKYMFSIEDRIAMIKSVTGYGSFWTNSFNGLVVEYANKYDSPILIRGIRNTTDMLEEMKLADINMELGGVETIFIPCSNDYRNVSSSLVKELIKYNRDISSYVPIEVYNFIKGY